MTETTAQSVQSQSVQPDLPTVNRQPAEVLGPRAQQTIVRIIDATREVFLARGYGGTTIDEVAKLADVSRASVYTYFASKRELLLAVGEKAADATSALIDRLPAIGTTRAGLRAWIDEFFDILEIYGSFAFAWTEAANEDARILSEGRRRHLRLAKRLGAALLATSGRAGTEPIPLGIVAFSLLERSWSYSRLYGDMLDLGSVKDEAAMALWASAREVRTKPKSLPASRPQR
jgi:AcrR family transcriptional regulator